MSHFFLAHCSESHTPYICRVLRIHTTSLLQLVSPYLARTVFCKAHTQRCSDVGQVKRNQKFPRQALNSFSRVCVLMLHGSGATEPHRYAACYWLFAFHSSRTPLSRHMIGCLWSRDGASLRVVRATKLHVCLLYCALYRTFFLSLTIKVYCWWIPIPFYRPAPRCSINTTQYLGFQLIRARTLHPPYTFTPFQISPSWCLS